MATPSVVDVWIAALNQTQAPHGGALGRITELQNGLSTHYTAATASAPAKFGLETRDGFASLSAVLRSSVSGEVVSGDWSNPQSLNALADQLVSICGSVPRVHNGSDWTSYDATRVKSNIMSESTFHTTSRVMAVPTSAVIGNVTCSVWTETAYATDGSQIDTTFVGFKNGDAWVRTPSELFGRGVAGKPVLAKVVTDGTYFYAFINEDADVQINIYVFDTHGAQLGFNHVVKNSVSSPGDWDVTYLKNGKVVLIQPHDGTGADAGVDLSTIVYAAGTVTETRVTDATAHCIGPLSWLTNDLDNVGYFATLGPGSGDTGTIYGYQTAGIAHTHEFQFAATVAHKLFLDSFIGWPVASGTANQPTLYVGVAYLADGTTASAGPKYDPAFRTVTVRSCTWVNVVTVVRKDTSVVPVSRAFKHDGEYFYHCYYQSGSGKVSTVAPITVANTFGDFMTGPVSQPVTVKAGDLVEGPAVTLTGQHVSHSAIAAPVAITTGDKVELYTVVTGDPMNGPWGLPVGTQLLKWTIANLTGGNRGALKIVGSSNLTANGTWQLPPQSGTTVHEIFSYVFNELGNAVTPATFTALGGDTAELPEYWAYAIPNLPEVMTVNNGSIFLNAGTLTWSGDAVAGNNGTFTIRYAGFDPNADPNTGFWRSPNEPSRIEVLNTTQGVSVSAATAVVSPQLPDHWFFNSQLFDSSYVNTYLTLSDASGASGTPAVDLGTFKVTASSGGGELTTGSGDATGVLAYQWGGLLFPVVSIDQDITQAYRFRLQAVTFDYSYIGGLISVLGDIANPQNNGTYKILSIDRSDVSNHTVFVEPTSVTATQRNQNLTGVETITILPPTSVAPEFQPSWFIKPATGTMPVVGAYERGIADADWRQEGQIISAAPLPNLYPRALSDVCTTSTGLQVVLPYRARSFTAGQLVVAPTGQVVNTAQTSLQSTIGTKAFTLSTEYGDAAPAFNELMLPGPMAASFTESGFHEQGISLGPELPFVVSEETDTAATVVGLVPLQKYFYQVVSTVTDENGDFVTSIPSPVLTVTLTGTNNTVTIGGRTINPLGANGLPASGVYGLSNRFTVTTSIYRSAVVNGRPTTNLYQITDPLNSNGPLYPGSGSGSGFTFLSDNCTWYFRDQVADAVIVDQDIIYTGQGFLPTYPAPAFRQGCVWQNRAWLCAYDGALWMSNEKQEGSGLSFFPGFRYLFPAKAVACAFLDSFLYVFCDDESIWYIPATTYPDATGNPNSGTLPTPRRLPFRNSCTGHATTIREGVVYSSTSGDGAQLWLLDRSQQNHWLSQAVQDSFASPITGLAVDSKQRLYVANGQLWCYDGIPGIWSQATVPTAPSRVCAFAGAAVYQDTNRVNLQVPGQHHDAINGTTYPIPLSVTLAGINFAQVRSFTRLWALQVIGEYRGPHNLNAVITYPDDMPNFPTQFGPFPASSTLPYLLEVNPINELCSTYGLQIWSSFEGVGSPGDSFTLELVSAKVGLSPGQRDVPSGQRVSGR